MSEKVLVLVEDNWRSQGPLDGGLKVSVFFLKKYLFRSISILPILQVIDSEYLTIKPFQYTRRSGHEDTFVPDFEG